MVGIAIINYNTYEKTLDCIDSIRQYTTVPYKIYLLDNASPNESAAILGEAYKSSPDVVFIASEENLGYARGNNLCMEYMVNDGYDYCLISNNDILCHDGTIDKMYECLVNNSEYAIVAPKIKGIDGKFQDSFKIKKPSKIEYLQQNTYFANFFKKKNGDRKIEHNSITDFSEVYWVSGAFFMCNLENMKQIGYFDPYTFLFYEESILSYKCQKAKYKIGYLPSIEVTHYHAVSTGGGINIVTKTENFRSELYYWKMYENAGKAFLCLLYRIRLLEVTYTFAKKKSIKEIRDFYRDGRKMLQDTEKLGDRKEL